MKSIKKFFLVASSIAGIFSLEAQGQRVASPIPGVGDVLPLSLLEEEEMDAPASGTTTIPEVGNVRSFQFRAPNQAAGTVSQQIGGGAAATVLPFLPRGVQSISAQSRRPTIQPQVTSQVRAFQSQERPQVQQVGQTQARDQVQTPQPPVKQQVQTPRVQTRQQIQAPQTQIRPQIRAIQGSRNFSSLREYIGSQVPVQRVTRTVGRSGAEESKVVEERGNPIPFVTASKPVQVVSSQPSQRSVSEERIPETQRATPDVEESFYREQRGQPHHSSVSVVQTGHDQQAEQRRHEEKIEHRRVVEQAEQQKQEREHEQRSVSQREEEEQEQQQQVVAAAAAAAAHPQQHEASATALQQVGGHGDAGQIPQREEEQEGQIPRREEEQEQQQQVVAAAAAAAAQQQQQDLAARRRAALLAVGRNFRAQQQAAAADGDDDMFGGMFNEALPPDAVVQHPPQQPDADVQQQQQHAAAAAAAAVHAGGALPLEAQLLVAGPQGPQAPPQQQHQQQQRAAAAVVQHRVAAAQLVVPQRQQQQALQRQQEEQWRRQQTGIVGRDLQQHTDAQVDLQRKKREYETVERESQRVDQSLQALPFGGDVRQLRVEKDAKDQAYATAHKALGFWDSQRFRRASDDALPGRDPQDVADRRFRPVYLAYMEKKKAERDLDAAERTQADKRDISRKVPEKLRQYQVSQGVYADISNRLSAKTGEVLRHFDPAEASKILRRAEAQLAFPAAVALGLHRDGAPAQGFQGWEDTLREKVEAKIQADQVAGKTDGKNQARNSIVKHLGPSPVFQSLAREIYPGVDVNSLSYAQKGALIKAYLGVTGRKADDPRGETWDDARYIAGQILPDSVTSWDEAVGNIRRCHDQEERHRQQAAAAAADDDFDCP